MIWQYRIRVFLNQSTTFNYLPWLKFIDIYPLLSLSVGCHEYVMNDTFHTDCQPSSQLFEPILTIIRMIVSIMSTITLLVILIW
jgi:hypothetical protein